MELLVLSCEPSLFLLPGGSAVSAGGEEGSSQVPASQQRGEQCPA